MREIGTRLTAVLAALATAGLAAACSTAASGSPATSGSLGGKIIVVAAENFWGSIAAQLGGTHVTETSIITNPNTDPHDYEPTAGDARAIAAAQLVDRQRHRLRRLGDASWSPRTRSPGRTDADRRRPASA